MPFSLGVGVADGANISTISQETLPSLSFSYFFCNYHSHLSAMVSQSCSKGFEKYLLKVLTLMKMTRKETLNRGRERTLPPQIKYKGRAGEKKSKLLYNSFLTVYDCLFFIEV